MYNSRGSVKLILDFFTKEEKGLSNKKTFILLFLCILGVILFWILLSKYSTIRHYDNNIKINREYGIDPANLYIRLISDYHSLGTSFQEGSVGCYGQFVFNHPRCVKRKNKTSLQSNVNSLINNGITYDSIYDKVSVSIKSDAFHANNLATLWLKQSKAPVVEEEFDNRTRDNIRYALEFNDTIPSTQKRIKNNSIYFNYTFYIGADKGKEILSITANMPCSEPIFGGPDWLALEDISQRYYNVKIQRLTKDTIMVNDSIILDIDFGGAIEFTDFPIEPDHRTVNSIQYTDKDKIRSICDNGLTIFCKFPEMTNKQELRLFLVTTMLTILITQSLIYIYRLLKKYVTKWESRYKLIIWGLSIFVLLILYTALYEEMSSILAIVVFIVIPVIFIICAIANYFKHHG